MNIIELYDKIFESGDELDLSGEIELHDDEIKWEYDAISSRMRNIDEFLLDICQEDCESLFYFLKNINYDDFFIFSKPEIYNTRIVFYITEK